MTEPNVLGNASPAKFIWDNGNTSIVNLWRKSLDSGVESMYHEDSGTVNGQAFVVPADHAFYLLSFRMLYAQQNNVIALQGNTSVDTSSGGTTKAIFRYVQNPSDLSSNYGSVIIPPEEICVKFTAGEYITPYDTSGADGDFFCIGWGVLCDA